MIKQKEYQRRRSQLMRRIGEGAIVVICASPARTRNSDVHYPYRQHSDFLYLSGFREPEAALVLIPEDEKAVMFCRPRDPEREMWDGVMAGLEGAVEDFGMTEAYDIGEIEKRLPKMLRDRDRVFYDLGEDTAFDQKLIGWMHDLRETKRRTFHVPEEIHGLDHMLHDMRLYKSREEIRVMKRSAQVAIEAHEKAMKVCKPGMNEADIHAELLHTFIRNQCEASYLPIVGGGANACVLHYIENNAELDDNELLLIDAGAEYDGYASDITRTFPINGSFTAEQRELYDLVLAAQLEAIDHARTGNQWEDVHDAAVRVATQGMVDLGILKGDPETIIEEEAYTRLYVHKTGHWLGLDVHDVGEYQIDGHSRELEPGMVLTVEPGIYIAADDESVDKRWRGIGIRIEDDVAVTKDDPQILSDGLVKTADDVEAFMKG